MLKKDKPITIDVYASYWRIQSFFTKDKLAYLDQIKL